MVIKGDYRAFQVELVVKNPPTNAGDVRDAGLISGLGRLPGGGHDNPLQGSCLENPHGQRSLAGYSSWGRRVRHDWSNLAGSEVDYGETSDRNEKQKKLGGKWSLLKHDKTLGCVLGVWWKVEIVSNETGYLAEAI